MGDRCPLAVIVAGNQGSEDSVKSTFPVKNTFIHFPDSGSCVQRFRTEPPQRMRVTHADSPAGMNFSDSQVSTSTSGSSTPKSSSDHYDDSDQANFPACWIAMPTPESSPCRVRTTSD